MKESEMANILLVEDNEVSSDVLLRYLNHWGYEATTAKDGEEAVRIIYEVKLDLILMDFGLPKLSGWELTRLLKTGSETRHIPIIAVTGFAMEGDREAAFAVGCDEYVSKPIDFVRLRGMIESFL